MEREQKRRRIMVSECPNQCLGSLGGGGGRVKTRVLRSPATTPEARKRISIEEKNFVKKRACGRWSDEFRARAASWWEFAEVRGSTKRSECKTKTAAAAQMMFWKQV